MDAGESKPSDSKAKSNQAKRFGYDARTMFYGALLLFILIGSASIMGIPSFRDRLIQRTEALWVALLGNRAPVTADIGEMSADYPEEFKREEYTFPDAGQILPEDWVFKVPSEDKSDRSDSALISPKTVDLDSTPADTSVSAEDSEKEDLESSGSEPGYTTGKTETEAYTLLLEKYPKVEAMVNGDNSSLQFKSWGGSRIEEEIYWIRLIFEIDNNREVYIWQVDLKTKEVTPLSYNARSIS
ncbi:MAG: hypothetical protein P8Z37_08200 [Acidobacteriota bacterium]|jgi:hypothetical protein